MSEYSTCFKNGMGGNCNATCEDFQIGCCDVGDEALEQLLDEDDFMGFTEVEICEFIEMYG
jgi:predicted lactoylglutathione lyase